MAAELGTKFPLQNNSYQVLRVNTAEQIKLNLCQQPREDAIQTTQNISDCKGRTASPVNSPHQFQLELLRLLFPAHLHVQTNPAGLALCSLPLGGPGSALPSTTHF